MLPELRFGTLGAAQITPIALIRPVSNQPRARVVAIAARDRRRAEAFAAREGIARVLDGYQGVIDHPDVNAIYNPLVISQHKPWSIQALAAGHHVLCEKSLALNEAEARAMAETAAQHERILMDAFHYRYHPVFKRAVEVVQSGLIGEFEHVEGHFHIPLTDPDDIRLNYALGGGVTMDIGCYPVSWLRHLTGEEPRVIDARAVIGPPAVDISLVADYRFSNGATGRSSGDMSPDTTMRADLAVRGSAGTLHVQNPLAPQLGHRITITTSAGEEFEQFDRKPSYDYQLEAFLEAVATGTPPLTDAWDAVKQMRLIDAVYEAAGLPIRGAR